MQTKLQMVARDSVSVNGKSAMEVHDLASMVDAWDGKVPNVNELLLMCTDCKCSDLWLKVGQQPYISRWGHIYQVPCMPVTQRVWNEWAKEAISSEQNAQYVRNRMLDASYVVSRDDFEYRYRMSAGYSMGKPVCTFRMIAPNPPSLDTVNLPPAAVEIFSETIKRRQGIIMVNGVTGSGKSTTIAACINSLSRTGGPMDQSTVVSLEDPVEHIHESRPGFNIMQKQLGLDFKTFALGVKQALREHPSFINVGETRDVETIQALVESSRTGHACITSYHANSVGDTLSRMWNMLHDENGAVMYDLVTNLSFVFCQRLLPDEHGFVMDTQWLLLNESVKRHLIKCVEADLNIPNAVESLMQNQELIKNGAVKNWEVV